VLIALVLAWGGRKAYLAHKNLVTLDVYQADVRDVIRSCERQTWEIIVVHKDVKGKITHQCHNVPLEEVLAVIGEQTSSRPLAIYPIFSSGKSIVNLRKLVRGDIEREGAGWTNLSMRGFGGRGGFGGFGGGGPGPDGLRSQDSPVTLNVSGKDLNFAALALSRFSHAQVVPEDGADALITLSLRDVPFRDAVAKIAKEAKRKSDVLYALEAQPDFFGRDDGDRGDRGGRREDGFGRGRFNRDENETNWQARAEARAEERDTQRQREMEARLATMTPEEQAKAKEQQQQFEQVREMTPEQRQQFFEQMRNNPENRQRFENRRINYVNNSSPEQRADRTKQMMERRARRQQQPQQPTRR
jgi:hypothetical protein